MKHIGDITLQHGGASAELIPSLAFNSAPVVGIAMHRQLHDAGHHSAQGGRKFPSPCWSLLDDRTISLAGISCDPGQGLPLVPFQALEALITAIPIDH